LMPEYAPSLRAYCVGSEVRHASSAAAAAASHRADDRWSMATSAAVVLPRNLQLCRSQTRVSLLCHNAIWIRKKCNSQTWTHRYNALADHIALHLLQPLANPQAPSPSSTSRRGATPAPASHPPQPCSRSSSLSVPPRAARPLRVCAAAGELGGSSTAGCWGVKLRRGRRRPGVLSSHKAL
jgi:hypothetical protein